MATLRIPGAVLLASLSCVVAAACGGSSTTDSPAPVLQKTAASSGEGQTGFAGSALANPLRVLVTLSGAPQSGTSVSWVAVGAGASAAPATSVTDATGIATATWTLGSTVGAQTATATLPGATGSPVTFTATAVAATAIQMAATASGDGQSGTVGNPLGNPLRVLVTLLGAPEQGVSVSWAAAGTGAAVNPATSLTDASGIAATTWTISQTAGSQSATATLAGASGSPVTFGATGAPRAAAFLALISGDNQTGAPNAVLNAPPLTVKATDQFGNAVSGESVSWAVTGGTASVNPTTGNTGANGQAQTVLTLGATPGPVTVTATSGILSGSPVTFHATIATLPASAAVSVGDFFFRSGRNLTQNPAVDTIGAGGTVTWTWVGAASHGVNSTGSPTFTSSTVKTSGTYAFTFATPGTYTYDCTVHGSLMTGRIVVQ
jgi:plastocyanin